MRDRAGRVWRTSGFRVEVTEQRASKPAAAGGVARRSWRSATETKVIERIDDVRTSTYHIAEALFWREVEQLYRDIILLQIFMQPVEVAVSP